MLRLASERDSLAVVADQIGTPTNANDLASFIMTIIKGNSQAYGVYHFSNEGQASWFEFAKKIFEFNQIDIPLNPITTKLFPTPAKRPKYSVLDKTKAKEVFGISIPAWEDSLKGIASSS